MSDMSAKLVTHDKQILSDGKIVEIKIWKIPATSDKPHGYKYSLIYISRGRRVIGYDNSEGKGDHVHHGEDEAPYEFKDIRKLIKDFYDSISEAEK